MRGLGREAVGWWRSKVHQLGNATDHPPEAKTTRAFGEGGMRSRLWRAREARLVAWAFSAEIAAAALLLGGGIARQHCEISALLRAASAPTYEAAEAAYAQAAACYGERLPTLEERSRRAWEELEIKPANWI